MSYVRIGFFNDNGAHLKGPIDIYDDRHGTQITELANS